jgi:hypothetical protein
LELLPSQIDTQPGELFHVCLSKISYYWLSNQFDSGLLSKLILMLKRQDQRHGKLIESIAEIVKILYRKDYEKFTLFMSDFVQLVQGLVM